MRYRTPGPLFAAVTSALLIAGCAGSAAQSSSHPTPTTSRTTRNRAGAPYAILTRLNTERIPCTFVFTPSETIEGQPLDYLCSPAATGLTGLLGQVSGATATLAEQLPAGVDVQPATGERLTQDAAGNPFLVSTVTVLGESLLGVDDPRCSPQGDRASCLDRLWQADPATAPPGPG